MLKVLAVIVVAAAALTACIVYPARPVYVGAPVSRRVLSTPYANAPAQAACSMQTVQHVLREKTH